MTITVNLPRNPTTRTANLPHVLTIITVSHSTSVLQLLQSIFLSPTTTTVNLPESHNYSPIYFTIPQRLQSIYLTESHNYYSHSTSQSYNYYNQSTSHFHNYYNQSTTVPQLLQSIYLSLITITLNLPRSPTTIAVNLP